MQTIITILIYFLTINILAQTPDTARKYPTFNGGQKTQEFYASKIKYPRAAMENDIMGTVLVEFIVDTIGNIDSVKIKHSVHPLLDNEALRVVKLTSGSWLPATIDGRPVNSKTFESIIFKLVYPGVKTSDHYYNQGVEEFNKGNYDIAIKYFSSAIKLNPLDIDALYNRGICYMKKNQLKSACNDWEFIKYLRRADADKLLDQYCK